MNDQKPWETLLASLAETTNTIFAYIPNMLVAVLLMLAGWLVARITQRLTQVVVNQGYHVIQKLTPKSISLTHQFLTRCSNVLSRVVFWIVLIIFAGAALYALSSELYGQWSRVALGYLPNVVAAVIIILLGFLGGSFCQQMVDNSSDVLGLMQSQLLAKLSYLVVVLLGLVIGISQMGIDLSLLVNIVTVLLFTGMGGLALTVALSSRQQVSNYLASCYVRKSFEVNDLIQINHNKGRILEINEWAVVLESEQGSLTIPASHFLQYPCLKLAEGGDIEKP